MWTRLAVLGLVLTFGHPRAQPPNPRQQPGALITMFAPEHMTCTMVTL